MYRNADRAEKETRQYIPKNSLYSQHLLLPRTAEPQATSAGQAPQSWTFRIAAPLSLPPLRAAQPVPAASQHLLVQTKTTRQPGLSHCSRMWGTKVRSLPQSLGGQLEVFFPLQIKTAPEVTWLASSVKTPAHLLVTKQYPSCTFWHGLYTARALK